MPYRYLLFYKPYNVLSQFTDDSPNARTRSAVKPATLKDFIPVANVYPVGRLDHDSEGLMLLTDNGQLQHRLSDPKFHHTKTYWAQVENVPTESAIAQLRTGVNIQNYRTRPAIVDRLDEPDLPPRDPPIRFRKNIPTAWLEITLTEGRNRQVRRMTAAVGFPTLRLVRTAISQFRLTDLSPGQWRDLNTEELQLLKRL
ncbi:MAG: pseudouridine synthase [Plectolyngbya sp. WJT66-NPBG17]|jgi:23S rRNA pseudouridine2457 synthase|nr:pseudouridine synthase [Plectolyngbya sp. WJT66-NPBG17]